MAERKFDRILRIWMVRKRISVRQLSQRSGISESQISRWRSGKTGTPNLANLRKLAEALGISASALVAE